MWSASWRTRFPLRCDLTGQPAFQDLLTSMQPRIVGLMRHQSLPPTEIVRTAALDRTGDENPLFRAAFNYVVLPEPAWPQDVWAQLRSAAPTAVWRTSPKFELGMTLVVDGEGGGLLGELEFQSPLLDRGAAERLAENFRTLLAAAVAHPDRAVSDLDLLGAEEREWLDARGGRVLPPAAPEEGTTLDRIRAQADRTPDAVALTDRGRDLTYRQLWEAVASLAGRLRAGGVGRDVLVGVHLPRSAETVVAMLAVWQAGGAYVPLDPAYPAARLQHVLDDSGLRTVITRPDTTGTLDTTTVDVIPSTTSPRRLSARAHPARHRPPPAISPSSSTPRARPASRRA
ncbi:AMP-binding protein [Streptomyces subrutilus]|uniref:AMP-dependent synthetase/ligase domain-containing protein n=1 Tax=Streptomyces subrutilus TaxID=36818 RepID=A0A1E5NZK1_9ACTN|nr:AMP-binding protein [Streptomyces subrutilus]OEJ21755.1 hypothetical protein BGK67_35585 [Streptomyces subrutilus]